MARPKKYEDEKAVGLHTTIPPKIDKEIELRRKQGITRSFIVTKALELYFSKEDPTEKELKAS